MTAALRPVVHAVLAVVLLCACGDSGDGDSTAATPASTVVEVIEAQEAINGIATPPVPTGVIDDARSAAAGAGARVHAVDSILGSQ